MFLLERPSIAMRLRDSVPHCKGMYTWDIGDSGGQDVFDLLPSH